MRQARARSFSLPGFTSTIRLLTTLPNRIIEIVVSILSTSLVAVPALSRVEPGEDLWAGGEKQNGVMG